jgi:spermidine/putrescine transport system substrate-binding protein
MARQQNFDRRIFLMGITGAASGCLRTRLPRLNVYNWESYVAASTISDFEREFHCQVRYATYGSAEEMLAKVMSGNSGWDVVFPSNSFVAPMRELSLLLPLDHSRLPNIRNLDLLFQSPEWDPQLSVSVPYMHSATGILYSDAAVPPPLSWSALWTDAYHRRVTMLDDPAEVFAVCLKRNGHSINSGDPTELKISRDMAEKQKPLLRAYLNEEVKDQVVAGDVLVAQMWAQVAEAAMENSPKLKFAYPTEGFALYADVCAILRESEHVALAHDFINYLLRPTVAAAIAIEIRGATANAAARALLPQSLRDNSILYPSPDVLVKGEWFRPLPQASQRLRDRYWTEIKSS